MSREYDSKLDGSQTPKPETSIKYVPTEVMKLTGSFCDTRSLAALAVTSKYHHRIFREDKKGELRKRAVQQLLHYIVAPKPEEAPEALNKAEAIIKANPDLLLEIGEVETYAADLEGNHVWVSGTPLGLALAAEDHEMAVMIAKYLDEYFPGEKQRQHRAQFPNEEKEEKTEDFAHTADGKALHTIVNAIGKASDRACEQVLNHEREIAADDKEAQTLLTELNAFREYIKPKGVITTGKHFNMQLLIKAFALYDRKYVAFGHWDSHKNNLCWRKLIGYMQRFLPACYAQAFAQGIHYIVECGGKLRRSFEFRYGGGSYFPLDSDPNFRLGYNYAAARGNLGRGDRGMAVVDGSDLFARAPVLRKLCQAKTATLQRIMQQPNEDPNSWCLMM